MVLTGYQIAYGVECDVAGATKFLKLLLKDAGVTNKATYEALQLGLVEQICSDHCDSEQEKELINLIEGSFSIPEKKRKEMIPHAFALCINALLKKKGFKSVELITKHCCFNDNQVFFGFIAGNNEVICGNDVEDYETCDEWFSEELKEIRRLANDCRKCQDPVDEELRHLFTFAPELKRKAKIFKFANDCDSCS